MARWMKRLLVAALAILSMWVLVEIGKTISPSAPPSSSTGSSDGTETDVHHEPQDTVSETKPDPVLKRLEELLSDWKVEEKPRKLKTLADQYGWTGVNIVKEHGFQGAEAILALGQEGVALMREDPEAFQKLAQRFGGKISCKILVLLHKHLKEFHRKGYLSTFLKLLDDIEAFPENAKELAEKYPLMIPFYLLAPKETEEALRLNPELAFRCLILLDLSKGKEDVKKVAQMFLEVNENSKTWIEQRGLDGLLLANQFPEWVQRTPPMDLPIFLQVLSTNQKDLRHLKELGKMDLAWEALSRFASEADQAPAQRGDRMASKDDWYSLATTDERLIRYLVEFDPHAKILEKWWPCYLTLEKTGPLLPSLIMDGYHADRFPQKARKAFRALEVAAQKGENELLHTYQILVRMAQFQPDPPDKRCDETYDPYSFRFHDLLNRLDHRVVFYVLDALKHSGKSDEAAEVALTQAFQRLQDRGLDELNGFESPPSLFIQCIPGYDAYHLIWVLSKGYTPTWSEGLFGVLDVVFTAPDVIGIGKAIGIGGKAIVKGTTMKEVAEAATKKMLGKLSRRVAKNTVEDWARRGVWEIVASSPHVVKQASVTGRLGCLAYWAERSAKFFNIAIRVSKKAAVIFVREWAIGIGGAKTVEELAHLAASSHPAIHLMAEKIFEFLQNLEQPIR